MWQPYSCFFPFGEVVICRRCPPSHPHMCPPCTLHPVLHGGVISDSSPCPCAAPPPPLLRVLRPILFGVGVICDFSFPQDTQFWPQSCANLPNFGRDRSVAYGRAVSKALGYSIDDSTSKKGNMRMYIYRTAQEKERVCPQDVFVMSIRPFNHGCAAESMTLARDI